MKKEVVDFLVLISHSMNPDDYTAIYEILEWHYPEEVKEADAIVQRRLDEILKGIRKG